jgi:type I restriction enzyme S subunit
MSRKWDIVPISQIARKMSRPESVDSSKVYRLLGAHWYAKGLYVKDEKPGMEIRASKLFAVKPGDFVYNRLFAWKGSFAVAQEEHEGCFVSNEFPYFELDRERVSPKFLWLYFSRESAWLEALGLSSGSTPTSRNRLKEEQFLQMQIPLPPLDEQRRIVARIEELAALIEEAQGLRREEKEEMKALLASAKNEIFNEEFYAKWPAVTLGEVADIGSGVTLGRSLSGITIQLPYLRVANVQDGYLDLREVKEVEIRASEREKWLLQPGDILLTEGGDWDKLGRGTVWHGEIPNCIHQNHIFRVRVDPDEFVPEYLSTLIGSPYGKAYFQAASKQTTNLATINKRQLKAFVVLCPPLSEQRRIVAYLDDLQAQMDELTALQEATQAELDALLPSVLDRAFKGEL